MTTMRLPENRMRWQEVINAEETFPAILSKMADAHPNQIFAHNVLGDSLTWEKLQLETNIWAARFVALDVKKGDVVSTIIDADLVSLPMWLGLASIGAIDALTNSQYRGRMLANAINTCRPTLIVVAHAYLPFLEAIASDLDAVTRVLVVDQECPAETETKLPGLVGLSQVEYDLNSGRRHMTIPRWHDVACVSFTSGTTGPSKAVILPWGHLHCGNLATYPFEDLTSSDVFYSFVAHAHFGSKSIPYLAAMARGRIVIRPRFSVSSFWDDIARFGVTTVSLVGTMADMLMRNANNPPERTTLRNIFMTPLGATATHFSERFGTRVCTVYSSTELSIPICSGWNPTNTRAIGCLRKGYPGFEVRIVDEHDYEVADGTPGECVVRSAIPWTMNAGYMNNPEATAKAWRNGWYHTGDALVRTPDGEYVFVDRMKDVVRRRGENISSFEVEAEVLLNPDVAECVAVAVPADTTEDEILLFVVRRSGSALTVQGLCADLEGRMTRFMVPRYVELLDSLPKTQATERVMKATLRQRGVGPNTWDRERQSYANGRRLS